MNAIKKLPWPEIVVSLAVIAIGVGVYAYAHRDEDRLEESRQRGATIVAALEVYQREHGTYPERLDQLVPRHLPTLDPPSWGLRRWQYRRFTAAQAGAGQSDDVYFHLSVAADETGYPLLYYDIAVRSWVLSN